MDCRDNFDLVNHYLIAPLSIFFNIFALYIINKRANIEILSTYRMVLLIICVVDLFNSCYFLFIDLHIELVNDIPLYFFLGQIKPLLNFLPPEAPQYAFAIYLTCQCSITNMCIPPFVYRYLLVCHNMKPTNKKVFLIYFIFLLPLFIHFPLRIYLCLRYEKPLLELLPPDLDLCPGEKFITGYRTTHIQDNFDLFLNLVANLSIMGSTAFYLLVLWCAVKIILFLHNNKAYVQNPKLQREISWTLGIQAIIPFVIAGGPSIFGSLLTMFLHQKSLAFGLVLFRFRMYIPLLNPIILKNYDVKTPTRPTFFKSTNFVFYNNLLHQALSPFVCAVFPRSDLCAKRRRDK